MKNNSTSIASTTPTAIEPSESDNYREILEYKALANSRAIDIIKLSNYIKALNEQSLKKDDELKKLQSDVEIFKNRLAQSELANSISKKEQSNIETGDHQKLRDDLSSLQTELDTLRKILFEAPRRDEYLNFAIPDSVPDIWITLFYNMLPRSNDLALYELEFRIFAIHSGLFDPEWYRTNYGIASSDEDELLNHYLETGHELGYSPSLLFDGQSYSRRHLKVANIAENPLWHYVKVGIRSGLDADVLA